MKIVDLGVSPSSYTDTHIATPFAKQCLFYLIMSGEFFCSRKYSIDRSYLDMFLLIYVRKGQLVCDFDDRRWVVNPGKILLMDCKQHHKYRAAQDDTAFQWFHFGGVQCQAYYDKLKAQGLLLSHLPSDSTLIHIGSILQLMQRPRLKEQTASILIHTILRDISEEPENLESRIDPTMQWAVDYIGQHFAEDISIQTLADQTNSSKYHFIRSFRKATGDTPHDHLIQVRLKRAMELLINQSLTIEAISGMCGFNSASHFTRTFRHVLGTTPGEFRKLYATQAYGRRPGQ